MSVLYLTNAILALIYFWPQAIFITILVGELEGPKAYTGMLKCDWLILEGQNFYFRLASDRLILEGQISYLRQNVFSLLDFKLTVYMSLKTWHIYIQKKEKFVRNLVI